MKARTRKALRRRTRRGRTRNALRRRTRGGWWDFFSPPKPEYSGALNPEDSSALPTSEDLAAPTHEVSAGPEDLAAFNPEGYEFDPMLTPQQNKLIIQQQLEENKNPNLTIADAVAMKHRAAEDRDEIIESLNKSTAELDNNKIDNVDQFNNKEMWKLSSLNGTSAKFIVTAITQHNMFQRRLDYSRGTKKSKYNCGSITCKQRGQKIKNALKSLLTINNEALGNIGLIGNVLTAADAIFKPKTARGDLPRGDLQHDNYTGDL